MSSLRFLSVTDEASAKRVEALARAIWPEHYTPIIGKAQVDYMLATFQTASAVLGQARQGALYYLIQSPEGRDIGYLSTQPQKGELFLSKLYLLKAERGKGYGNQVLDFLKEMAQARHLPLITLTVNKRNPTVDLYEKMGFRVRDSVVKDIGQGFVMDDYRMELSLEE